MENTQEKLIQLNVTPNQILDCMPVEFQERVTNAEQGFSDQELILDGIKFSVSYDGESELCGSIIEKPEGITEDEAVDVLKNNFEDDEDEEE